MTTKKNETNEIRTEYSERETLVHWLMRNSFQIGSVAILILGLWIAVKLAPIYQSLTEIIGRVNALEVRVTNTPTREEFSMIEGRLDRIQAGVDRLIELHLVK